MNDFPCTSCGACCKNIKGIKELESFDLGNGICKYCRKRNDGQTSRSKDFYCIIETTLGALAGSAVAVAMAGGTFVLGGIVAC